MAYRVLLGQKNHIRTRVELSEATRWVLYLLTTGYVHVWSGKLTQGESLRKHHSNYRTSSIPLREDGTN